MLDTTNPRAGWIAVSWATMTEPTRPPRPRSWREMNEWIADLLVRRTGQGVEAWNARIGEQTSPDEASLRAWLAEQGVTGYPAMLLVMERFGYPDYLIASVDELIEGQYADRPALRHKTYVALVTPRRTFAAVQPTTKKRVELGLRLADQAPAGRLERAPSFGQSSMTMKIGLASPDELDDEVERWLRRAYEENA